MPYSEAQKRATLKYKEKAYERMELTVKKGLKESYKQAAESKGLSFNAYVIQLIEKDMEDSVK